MSIEVTVFVPFTYESGDRLINGTAEIYGDESSYDVVKLLDRKNVRIDDPQVMRSVRSDLLFSQYVYASLLEAISMEHDAR